MSVVELFCDVNDFCQIFQPVYQAELVAAGLRERLV